ncbi:hypothetical protein [Lutibacter citreus]|uniref:hypothetical protein n=1 Tax=Lutibacter citreus TaxID=2138210 RepID=UPI000DBE7103|nr:hypothetical protein [Lutibacter citreus]
MNQLHQILKVLLLISIYCFGIFAPVKTVAYSSAQKIEQNKKQKEYYTNVYKAPIVHTQQSENLVSENIEYITPNFNLHYKSFWETVVSSELIFKNKYRQYKNYFKNVLIRNRKSDLIFPFHNFW